MIPRSHIRGFVGAIALAIAGCEAQPPTAPRLAATQPNIPIPVSQPSTMPQPATLPESVDWTLEDAISRLTDRDADQISLRSAAVRLARLSQVPVSCLTDSATDDWLAGLRVEKLADDLWVLGLARSNPKLLGMPVSIDRNGRVQPLAPELEEEAATLYLSDDLEVFPHLVITPLRVQVVGSELRSALVCKSLGGARFEYRRKDDRWPYVAIVYAATTSGPATNSSADGQLATREPAIVAEYRWDPDEGAFIGPERDLLPNSAAARFVLDLRESKLLIPVGGEIDEPHAGPPANPPAKPRRDRDRPPD